jgi:hypothetical protein
VSINFQDITLSLKDLKILKNKWEINTEPKEQEFKVRLTHKSKKFQIIQLLEKLMSSTLNQTAKEKVLKSNVLKNIQQRSVNSPVLN